MAYLIIPVLCFVLLAALTWVLFGPMTLERVRTGKFEDLDVILSVLMTAEGDGLFLVMKVARRVTSMKATFPGSVVRLEMPLITHRQQNRKESYLEILRDLKLDARVSSHGGDHEILEWEVEGPPVRASAVIKEAFARLFEVDRGRALEFRVFAHISDQSVIDQGLRGTQLSEGAELPTAATRGRPVESVKETRAGCMTSLADVLLLPLPFMIAYFQFGYVAASAVLVLVIVFRWAYRRWKKAESGTRVANALRVVPPLLAGATIYFDDPFYLQLSPTTLLSVLAVAEILAVSFKLPHLSMFDPKKLDSPDYTGTVRMLLAFAFIATCIGGVAMNEYLRANVALDTWVWFFAFLRIELMLGFSVTLIPVVFYMARNTPREDDESDTP